MFLHLIHRMRHKRQTTRLIDGIEAYCLRNLARQQNSPVVGPVASGNVLVEIISACVAL